MKDKQFWDELYSGQSFEQPEPSKFLKDFYKYLKKDKVLDIACGTGWNSFFLAEQGYVVEGIDFSEVAISRAIEISKEKGFNLDFKRQSIDFYLGPIQKYNSTVVIDFKCTSRMLEEFKKGLVTGGVILIEGYTLNHMKNNPDADMDVQDCYKAFELARILKDWNMLYYDERILNNEYKVRALAIKPGF
jgi:tellurite methyltransferase